MLLQVAATPPKTVLVYTDVCLIQNTDVFGSLKWSWPEQSGRDRWNTHSYCTLRADVLGTGPSQPVRYYSNDIPAKYEGCEGSNQEERCFFKARKTQGKWSFSNAPMHNPVHFRAKWHVHTMLTVSVFTTWKHAVIFHINKTLCLILYHGKTNIKTLNLSHYACACFEFF